MVPFCRTTIHLFSFSWSQVFFAKTSIIDYCIMSKNNCTTVSSVTTLKLLDSLQQEVYTEHYCTAVRKIHSASFKKVSVSSSFYYLVWSVGYKYTTLGSGNKSFPTVSVSSHPACLLARATATLASEKLSAALQHCHTTQILQPTLTNIFSKNTCKMDTYGTNGYWKEISVNLGSIWPRYHCSKVSHCDFPF